MREDLLRGMYEEYMENKQLNVMKDYGLDVLTVCETKTKRYSENEVNGVFCLWSGVNENSSAKHDVGVGTW